MGPRHNLPVATYYSLVRTRVMWYDCIIKNIYYKIKRQ